MIISIVTITYNAEKVLQRTLDSVRSQTYKDIEHLIIDGASTDKSCWMPSFHSPLTTHHSPD